MEEILTRCGYRCDLCMAYRSNVEAYPDGPAKLSDGWHKYFGFRIPAEQILCDGCMAENPRLIDIGCPVRPCVILRNLENCAACPDYACDKLLDRFVDYNELARRTGLPVPAEDREQFILPYENRVRLDSLRSQAPGPAKPVDRSRK